MKLKTNTLSVVIPTYNCLHLIKRRLAHLQNWIHLADEVIVVDSRSQDGTIDYIKKMIQHPRCLYIERDRGLYESWNEAIAATSGDWIYISTAGDIIDKNHLLRLMNAGITSGADVVVSPQRFVSEDGTPYQGTDYKNADFYHRLNKKKPTLLSPAAVCFFAFEKGKPNALLGSCASDLFRGEFLRHRPFPTRYGTHGDTAWTLRHSSEMKLCVVPMAGADFCIHPKEVATPGVDLGKILNEIFINESKNAETYLEKKFLARWLFLSKLKAEAKDANQKRREFRRKNKNNLFYIFTYLSYSLHYFLLCLKLYQKEKSFLKKYLYEI